MRSCGGAVQGIREVAIPIETADMGGKAETMYHNRADDGFVYFDCGSYTQGPVQLKADADDGENENGRDIIVGSVSFATMPKSRVVFHCNISDSESDASSSIFWQGLVR